MFKKIMLISALLLSMVATSAYAAEADAPDADVKADIENPVEIVLQLGSDKILINDEQSIVEPPYLSQSTTLVPLRVITSSLGAVLQWDGATQTIVLTYGDKNIKLVIGSRTAETNGAAATIPAAPELKNGTTMVPLRFVVEYFGAEIAYESLEAPIRISGSRQDAAAASGSEIDSDVGKTRIGNSQYGWTMNYPTGLVKSYQSFLEDSYQFDDANGEYDLWINVDVDQDRISNDRLLQKAADRIGGTVLQKSFVANSDHPEQSYALVVSKDGGGQYDMLRVYQWEERIYYVWLTISNSEDYKNADKNRKYTELLDSFTPTFRKGDSKTKDLSTVKNGFRAYIGSDLGLDLSVPADWDTESNGEWVIFYSADEELGLNIRRTSVRPGDTLDQWIQRESAYLTDDYLSDYIKMEAPVPVMVAGGKGMLLKYATSEDGKTWSQVYGYYLFNGDYKYEIDFISSEGKQDEKRMQTIIDSVKHNPVGNEDAGVIEDSRDFIDRTKMTTVKVKDMNFSVDIPDYWTEETTYDDTKVSYSSSMGQVDFHIVENATLSQFKQVFDRVMESNKEVSPDFRVESSSSTTYAGVAAYKYVYSGTVNGVPFESTSYMMEKDGRVYGIDYVMLKAHTTAANREMQRAVLDSYQFLK